MSAIPILDHDGKPILAKKTKKWSAHQFFFSDEPYNLEKISHLCFNKKIKFVDE